MPAIFLSALLIKKHLKELSTTNCKNLNFSLDSLNQETFFKMTGSKKLKLVLESLFTAQELDFKVKVNVVLMKGYHLHYIVVNVHQR